MKPVVYIELPEAPAVLYGEAKDYFAVNLCCCNLPLVGISPQHFPETAASGEHLHEVLVHICRFTQQQKPAVPAEERN